MHAVAHYADDAMCDAPEWVGHMQYTDFSYGDN
jgi:hypothetical protein